MTEHIDPPVRLLARFQELLRADTPDAVIAAPGRAAWGAVRFTGTTYFTIFDADDGRRARFDVRSARRRQTLLHRPLPRWVRYAAGVTALLNVPFLPGADIVICRDEPPGPRSDHSLGILIATLWSEVNDLPADEGSLFQIAERIRREYIEMKVTEL